MKRALCVTVVILMAFSFSSMAFAGGPKCPCFKAKDLEKLVKKEWGFGWDQFENNVAVGFWSPNEEWNRTIKGKGQDVIFQWYNDEGTGEDVCYSNEYAEKWKSENYRDGKIKFQYRPLPGGGEDSTECKRILDDFIAQYVGP